jgi:hypothetical protein
MRGRACGVVPWRGYLGARRPGPRRPCRSRRGRRRAPTIGVMAGCILRARRRYGFSPAASRHRAAPVATPEACTETQYGGLVLGEGRRAVRRQDGSPGRQIVPSGTARASHLTPSRRCNLVEAGDDNQSSGRGLVGELGVDRVRPGRGRADLHRAVEVGSATSAFRSPLSVAELNLVPPVSVLSSLKRWTLSASSPAAYIAN